jgi:hypothetical protein
MDSNKAKNTQFPAARTRNRQSSRGMSSGSEPPCNSRHTYNLDRPLAFLYPGDVPTERNAIIRSKPGFLATVRMPDSSHESVLPSGITAGEYSLWVIRHQRQGYTRINGNGVWPNQLRADMGISLSKQDRETSCRMCT